jgi:hypothetical protein
MLQVVRGWGKRRKARQDGWTTQLYSASRCLFAETQLHLAAVRRNEFEACLHIASTPLRGPPSRLSLGPRAQGAQSFPSLTCTRDAGCSSSSSESGLAALRCSKTPSNPPGRATCPGPAKATRLAAPAAADACCFAQTHRQWMPYLATSGDCSTAGGQLSAQRDAARMPLSAGRSEIDEESPRRVPGSRGAACRCGRHGAPAAARGELTRGQATCGRRRACCSRSANARR